MEANSWCGINKGRQLNRETGERDKEDPAKTLSSQRECVCYKAVPSEG